MLRIFRAVSLRPERALFKRQEACFVKPRPFQVLSLLRVQVLNKEYDAVEQQWHFEQDESLKWVWKFTQEDEHTQSPGSFASCADCMLDAVRHTVQRRRASSPNSTGDAA